MIKIGWPTSRNYLNVEVWRLLDLSGLTSSVRQSRNYTKSGFVYVNDNQITNLKQTAAMGEPIRLELRFPNGKIQGEDIMVVQSSRHNKLSPRQASPGTNQSVNDPSKTNYRGNSRVKIS